VLSAGARLLEKMLDGVGSGWRFEAITCACGHEMTSHGRDEKRIRTILGDIIFRRSRYVCPSCGASRYPGDEALNVVGTGFSPGVKKLMSRAGSRGTFKEAQGDLKVYAEINVGAKDVERVAEGVGQEIEQWEKLKREKLISTLSAPPQKKDIPLLYISYDGTGVPMVPREVAGRVGKQPDGSSRTREVKLGCVFTQTTTDEEGRPARDDASTTFVGAIENAAEFGWRVWGEAMERGLDRAEKIVVIGDGAKWIWNLADLHFGNAIRIVDLYHAREHLYKLISLIADEDKIRKKLQLKWLTRLDDGKIEKITEEASLLFPTDEKNRKLAQTEIEYFENNKERMRYSTFREQDLFVGSGVVEAGCKSIIGLRLKRSGMEWTICGANSIISLRCAHLSNKIESFWEQNAA